MRKNLFVTYLTKSCLRVYISQLETTPLNMTTKTPKPPLTSGNYIYQFYKTAGQRGFYFSGYREILLATTGPPARFQPRKPASALKRPQKRSDRPQNRDFPGLRALKARSRPSQNRLQRKPYSVFAGQSFQLFSSRAVPYIDHKSLVRLALPKPTLLLGPGIHPSGCHELSGRTRRHLTASVTA